MTAPEKIPAEFDDLPEPGRTKALEFLKELIEGGEDEADALKKAYERAEHWIAERVPSG